MAPDHSSLSLKGSPPPARRPVPTPTSPPPGKPHSPPVRFAGDGSDYEEIPGEGHGDIRGIEDEVDEPHAPQKRARFTDDVEMQDVAPSGGIKWWDGDDDDNMTSETPSRRRSNKRYYYNMPVHIRGPVSVWYSGVYHIEQRDHAVFSRNV